jgi:hypothetical protein
MNRARHVDDSAFRFANRRALLRAGAFGGLGTLLAQLLNSGSAQGEAPSPAGSPKTIRSCILVFFYGGQSHLDTWDMKPDAPAEVRGEFRPIATRVPGLFVSEHLPHCARVADKLTIVRSVQHSMRNHNSAAVEALCGRTPIAGDLELLADTGEAFPCYGAIVSKLADRERGMPIHVALPDVMRNVVVLPGQSSGYLGPAYNAFQVTRDPNNPNFLMDELQLPDGVPLNRLNGRESLLNAIGSADVPSASVLQKAIKSTPPRRGPAASLAGYQHRAFSMLRSEEVRLAFEIDRESTATRERYGRNTLGQSLLLARRLVEAGVRFINVNDKFTNSQTSNWDSHLNNAARLKDDLLPPADLGFSALIEDLDRRGLLDSTLVVALGEFGRTPLINNAGGRDHWPDCFSAVLAGGGLGGGAVYGSSDKLGAHPSTNPVTPGDLAATIFWRFGLDPSLQLHDLLGRPQPLATGQPLAKLFST